MTDMARDPEIGMDRATGDGTRRGVSSGLSVAVEWVVGLALIAIVLVNVANAAGRYVFGRAIAGADELMVFAMVFIVMAGMVTAAWSASHIAINLLPSYARGRTEQLLFLVQDLVALCIALFATYASLGYVTTINRLATKSMALGLPMTIPHSALLFGFAGLSLIALIRVGRGILRLIAGGAR
ncbi:TRAP transporter small permease [Pseudohoeflea coraliihabitans]|uniref:TRAP transporter small permease protein n=1 Tax=Pseudohoeflea coraliihabitans TaxID=2860393 RepID=A0ABS6WQN2_9HYPH|nr:TRAP transporter small permease subunit [Pseudohoeflea sp. DP4N28-3]MBW3098274.1 TRAP transporter small permease subunit [Pseudohoeflea sp. DP4N28-3]